MKLKLTILLGTAALSIVLAGQAADSAGDGRSTKADQRSRSKPGERLGYPAKATEIMGMEIMDSANDKLGTVDELAVDLEAGRVVLVVVNSGGVLGIGAKTIALPPGIISYDSSKKAMRLGVDKEKFKAAPEFDKADWKSAAETNQLNQTYGYYGQETYFTDKTVSPPADSDAKAGASHHLGRVERASKVIGLPIVNTADKKWAEVDNLIVDLPAGRIVHVVVSTGGFLGMGDTLNAIPPGAFRHTPSGDSLQLDMTREELVRAPRFTTLEWPNFTDTAYSAKVYRSFGVTPYWDVDADNTARNVRDREDYRLTPLNQGTSDADVETTRLIRKEIVGREGLSVNAHNVKVITLNGIVTLRGPVNNAKEKSAIGEIARRFVKEQDVINQLDVKEQP